MYDCLTAMRLLYPYLDGELDVKESLKVQVHLQECPYCLQSFKRERDFLEVLRSAVNTPPSPPALRERVLQSLARFRPSPQPRFKFSNPLWAAAAAMLVLVTSGAFLYNYLSQDEQEHPRLAEVAVENHDGIIEGKLHFHVASTEPGVVVEWLEERLDFSLPLPFEGQWPMSLHGGRLVRLQDQEAAFLTFGSGKEKVSLLMTALQRPRPATGKAVPFGNLRFYLDRYKGYYTLVWTDAQLSYALVSGSKDRIAEACLICHAGSGDPEVSEFRDRI